ncbi:MAG TPA: ABC transporter ATP-binding protein [Acidimicrobiales bacterium]|nr:ABC transporter ATP-binding protein [Acidimicrobiales bacterium]
MSSGLAASVEVGVGDLYLGIDLQVEDGEVVALLGPNGAGKTTTLRVIAGLRPIDAGRIELDGAVLDHPATATFVPTWQRPIGFVFQDYRLFPRLSALDNVAFGLRARGATRADARREATTWLERFDLRDSAGDLPRALSAGQAQRVALARALATEPRLLLLDEPLAALDAGARLRVRTELRRHLATFRGGRLLVTHDPVDAFVLADRLVILEAGRITHVGPPAVVAARPRSPYVAQLLGVNLLYGTASGERTVRLETGAELTVADPLPGPDVAIAVRPQAIALYRRQPEGSPRNTWPATVEDLEADRDRVRVTLGGAVRATAEITPAAVTELDLSGGTPVWATVKAVDVTAYAR